MRYKPKSMAALQLALGGLPNQMRVEVDSDIEIPAKTVGELRKVTAWPENLASLRFLRSRVSNPSVNHP